MRASEQPSDIHVANCCAIHGCKFWDVNCPVTNLDIQGKSDCNFCRIENASRVKAGYGNISYILYWDDIHEGEKSRDFLEGEELKILEYVHYHPNNSYRLERTQEISLESIKPKNVVMF